MTQRSFLDGLYGLSLACLLGLAPCGHATAKTLTCNNCSPAAYASAARAAGTGEHLVLDYGRGQITRWVVYYDRELATWMADPEAVEAWMEDAFLDMAEAAKTSGRMSPQQKIVLTPGDPVFQAIVPEQFHDASAFDFTLNRTHRGQLSNGMGSFLYGSNPDSAQGTAGRVALFVASSLLKGLGMFVPDPGLSITLVWKDGSKTVFNVGPGNVDQPEYQLGQSRDSDGNPIPDESVVPGADMSCPQCFTGTFQFSGENVIRWLDVARGFGVQIVGSSSGQTETWGCKWNGEALVCERVSVSQN